LDLRLAAELARGKIEMQRQQAEAKAAMAAKKPKSSDKGKA